MKNEEPVLDYIKQRLDKIELKMQNEQKPVIINGRIYSLPNDRYSLVRPFDIILKIYPDKVEALLLEFELFADGENEFVATNNLKLKILDLMDDLGKSHYSELGVAQYNWKKILEKTVVVCNRM